MTLSADRPVVTLLDGRSVSSCGPEWQAECLARHQQVVRIMRLDDREARRDFIARYERTAADTAPPGTPDRAAYFCHPDWVVDPAKRPPIDLWGPRVQTEEGLKATAAWYRTEGWL